jgi:hypothetical protein
MDYNTTRHKLILSEYGRNVQSMVEYALSVEDREKRSRLAKAIVNVMAQVNPAVKESGDYKQKLWDQLHIIADFKLDVDSPYPLPSPDVLAFNTEKLSYRDKNFRYGHYGKNIEKIIQKASLIDDGPDKEMYVEMIANHLKKTYLTWNRDSVSDELIYEHLDLLSNGMLKLSDDAKLHNTNDILARNVKKKKFQRPKENNLNQRRNINKKGKPS